MRWTSEEIKLIKEAVNQIENEGKSLYSQIKRLQKGKLKKRSWSSIMSKIGRMKHKVANVEITSKGTPMTTNIFVNGKKLGYVQRIEYVSDISHPGMNVCKLIIMNPKLDVKGKAKMETRKVDVKMRKADSYSNLLKKVK